MVSGEEEWLWVRKNWVRIEFCVCVDRVVYGWVGRRASIDSEVLRFFSVSDVVRFLFVRLFLVYFEGFSEGIEGI